MRALFVLLLSMLCTPAGADEGMWPFDQIPKETLAQKHQFEVTDAFLERLRSATVRIAGGSGAFVSGDGLILTNQHLVAGCIAKPELGFLAPSRDAETKCPGLDAAVLQSIEDVTAKVKTGNDTVEARAAAIARIESECGAAAAGGRCSVVTLFAGGKYALYRYKVYGDVRLVFAPESDLAFFGRERDSITYLRYGLDVAFLRAWENGKPAATPGFLHWSAAGVKDGDLVFSAGNPEPTMRLATSAQLTFYRDAALPVMLARTQTRIRHLREFAAKGEENLSTAEPVLSRMILDFKLAAGKYIGLRDDRLVARKTIFEGKIRRAVERDPKLGEAAGKVWDEVASAYKTWAPYERPYQLLEAAPAPGSVLFARARQIIRNPKSVTTAEPVNDGVEALLLGIYLEELRRYAEKEVSVKSVMGSKTGQQAAEAMVKATRLKDPAEVRRLAAAGGDFRKSEDPILRLAALVDEPARRTRSKRAETIDALETTAADRIAGYRFQLFGATDYPDATSTPRVTFGVVKGYTDRAGVAQPSISTFGGLYYRRGNEGPYQIPQRWVDGLHTLDLFAPLDFVTTCDVGGGNPGAPTVNRGGELVGITFDGNLESLPGIYLYTDEQGRAVNVATQGIAESLKKIYHATALLQELGL